MFRALRLFPIGSSKAVLQVTGSPDPIDLAIQPEDIFATTVGSSTKKTLASWHVTGPQEIVEAINFLLTSRS